MKSTAHTAGRSSRRGSAVKIKAVAKPARAVRRGSAAKTKYYDDDEFGYLPRLGGVASATGLVISQQTALAISTVFACTTIRSKDVSRCQPRLMKVDAARSEKAITDHPVAKLFVRPNRIQTWADFSRQMHAAYLLRGNAYAVILRDRRGNPISLIPINPDAVLLYEAPDGSLFYSVTRYGFFQIAELKGYPLLIPEEDVFHLRGLSFNMLLGISLISIARDSFGVALGLEQQAARFMNNGARPSGVLQTDKKISTDTAKRLRDQWESLRSGIQNAGKTAILEEGLKWTAMQLSSVDLEFISQRTFSIGDIARWFDMPLYKLGVAGEMARIKMDDSDQAYVNTTIMPDLDTWEQKFVQKFDLDEEGLVADFDERRLLRAAEATRINNQRLKIMSGISTQNECRAENGDPPLPGGDVLLTPVNLAASGSDMTGTAPDGAGRPDAGTLPDPGAPNKVPSGDNNDQAS
jgi:HK97 family phage portal protein